MLRRDALGLSILSLLKNLIVIYIGFAMGRAKPGNLWVGPGLGQAWAQILSL